MIQRYDEDACDEYTEYFKLVKSPDGDWVLFSDHLSDKAAAVTQALAAKDAEIERLRSLLTVAGLKYSLEKSDENAALKARIEELERALGETEK